MSSFNGTIQEIPSIAIDNFERTDVKYYFLSHCHTDHLRGISGLSGDTLYATPISSFIIRRKYPTLDVRELEIGVVKNFEVSRDDGRPMQFEVTALSAGHCMGAAMFLFRIEGMDILYTGDFRISIENAMRMKELQEIVDYENLVLYLDSTFMTPTYHKFPKLKDSIEKTIEVTEKHLKACSSHRVHIQGSARYGYERLLIEMSQKLKLKFFCFEEEVSEQYSLISEISKYVTQNTYEARVFFKTKSLNSVDGKIPDDKNVLSINLSAMRWKNWNEKSSYVEQVRDDFFRVCYATHNSCEEIDNFMAFLKPKKVYLNVIPKTTKERMNMFKLLREIQSKYMELSDDEDEKPKLSKRLSFKRQGTNDEGTFKKQKL